MNKTLLLSAAVAGLLAATAVHADDAKCYGVAKAGSNACASATGTHSCKGQAKVDNDPGDFILASADDCAKQGGKTSAPAAK